MTLKNAQDVGTKPPDNHGSSPPARGPSQWLISSPTTSLPYLDVPNDFSLLACQLDDHREVGASQSRRETRWCNLASSLADTITHVRPHRSRFPRLNSSNDSLCELSTLEKVPVALG